MKTKIGTIDLEPTWQSLVEGFIEVLQNPKAKEESVKTVRDALYQMATVCDHYRQEQKRKEKETDKLLAGIVDICKPKFCKDTSVILSAKVKLTGFSGDQIYLNGLIGTTTHAVSTEPESAPGLVGINLYPGQRKPFSHDRINVPAINIMFIE